MNGNGKGKNTIYVVIFSIFTLFTWCPLGYGQYGPVGRIMGMPSWAALALLIGFIFFIVEWFYLFYSGQALDDAELNNILIELRKQKQ